MYCNDFINTIISLPRTHSLNRQWILAQIKYLQKQIIKNCNNKPTYKTYI